MNTAALYRHFKASRAVSTDSRRIQPGDMFFALQGSHFDGNCYALDALHKGAAWAVVDRPIKEADKAASQKIIEVADALKSLQVLANYHRNNCPAKVFALTGSNGKTTTKELLTAILSKRYRTQATPGNLNNHIGVPLTLLQTAADTEILILEMGDNRPGEIDALCQIAEPDFGYITNLGKDHLEGFGTMAANLAAKKELFDYLDQKGKTAFVNAGDEALKKIGAKLNKKHLIKPENPPFVKSQTPYLQLTDKAGNLIKTNIFGAYNIENIRSAYEIGKYFSVDEAEIQKAIADYIPSNNRSQFVKKAHNTLILDAYNANPSSVGLALESFATLETPLRKIVIFGDMLELGEISREEHEEIVKKTIKKPFHKIFFCGKSYFAHQCEGAHFYETKSALEADLRTQKFSGVMVLLKGSRRMALETLADLF